MTDAMHDKGEIPIFLPCWCGIFEELTFTTFCTKMKKTCNDWKHCGEREPRKDVVVKGE